MTAHIQHCHRAWVSGRVQGIGFRASTASKARRLGLRGYARNLADGRVEVLICGNREAVHIMLGWLAEGPPAAHVQNLEHRRENPSALRLPVGFDIR